MGRKLKVALLLPLIAAAGMSAPASASRIYGGYPWDVCSRWTEICYWI